MKLLWQEVGRCRQEGVVLRDKHYVVLEATCCSEAARLRLLGLGLGLWIACVPVSAACSCRVLVSKIFILGLNSHPLNLTS